MDVRLAMTRYPKMLPSKWLYDEVGSRLFDEMTRLPKYYQTETERAILSAHAREIVELSGATTLAELGSGTSDKTTTLLDAFTEFGALRTFVPVDLSEEVMHEAAHQLRDQYPTLRVLPIFADFTQSLSLPVDGPRLVAFMGGTLGNFYPDERRLFLEHLASTLAPGDHVLLGTDLLKSADRLVAAYHDEQRITERFILNVLTVMNNALDSEFDTTTFAYIPLWDAPNSRMDLRLRSLRDQQVAIPGAGITASFGKGEEIRIVISTKFRIPDLVTELETAGLSPIRVMTDPAEDYALSLARRQ